MKKLVGILITVVAIAVIIPIAILSSKEGSAREELGLLAVKYMYNFQNPYELDDNMESLKVITTDEVYDNLTIDKTDRVLNVYLKFKGKPVLPVIEKSTEKYIIYRLETDAISSSRRFVFYFDVNNKGKISWIREGELVDFNPDSVSDN